MTSEADLLVELAQESIFLWVEGERLRYRWAPGRLTNAHRTRIGKHRDRLVDVLARTEYRPLPSARECWPLDWQECFEERAAIMQYEGGLERGEAERIAEFRVRVLQLQSAVGYGCTPTTIENYPNVEKLSHPAEADG